MHAMKEGMYNEGTDIDRGKLCTVAEASRILGVSPATVWRWIDAGRLPAYRLGLRRILIRRRDLMRMVEPVRTGRTANQGESKPLGNILAGYDPAKAIEAINKAEGSWEDVDADALIDYIYRAREQGSRPIE